METELDLTGKVLVAMPGMRDPRFARAVILVCAHSAEGAMGLMVNKPMPATCLGDVLDGSDTTLPPEIAQQPVYIGGPVEVERGFVLHSGDYESRLKTLQVSKSFGMTATADIFEDMAAGQGPEQAILMLGYSGWGPGQLEQEIGQNGWLTCDVDRELVFATKDKKKWGAALDRIGIDPLGLSAAAGRA